MLLQAISLSILSGIVTAQSDPAPRSGNTYGGNWLETIRDSDVVASAFPDVEGIDLLSPYFTKPETRLPGFENGTQGPTDDSELGAYDYDCPSIKTDPEKITSTAR